MLKNSAIAIASILIIWMSSSSDPFKLLATEVVRDMQMDSNYNASQQGANKIDGVSLGTLTKVIQTTGNIVEVRPATAKMGTKKISVRVSLFFLQKFTEGRTVEMAGTHYGPFVGQREATDATKQRRRK